MGLRGGTVTTALHTTWSNGAPVEQLCTSSRVVYKSTVMIRLQWNCVSPCPQVFPYAGLSVTPYISSDTCVQSLLT